MNYFSKTQFQPGIIDFETTTSDHPGAYLELDSNGDLIVYHNVTMEVLWSSRTGDQGVQQLVLTDHGYLTLEKSDGTIVWQKP